MDDFIKTKLLFEYKKGQLIGFGYGNIIESDADIICISAFNNARFIPNSAIGCINELIYNEVKIDLEEQLNESFGTDGFQIFDFSNYKLRFKKLLLICMGERSVYLIPDKEKMADIVINNLGRGLKKAKKILSKEETQYSIDVMEFTANVLIKQKA